VTQPRIYLVRMLLFLAAVAAVTALLFDKLLLAFSNNPPLNGLIGFVLLAGIIWNLRQVLRLSPEVRWIEAFRLAPDRTGAETPPTLLASMASMLVGARAAAPDGSRVYSQGVPGASAQAGAGPLSPEGPRPAGRLTLSAATTRGMLDSLSSRLDESRELSRYTTGLLIFLGLLGTFWGLLLTVGSVSDVIGGLSVGSGDINAMFEQLKSGLARPLHGMGTAFSSSMFGLSGALVLGFLDLTAGQAQNRFFNELEEWLAGLTRVSSGVLGDGDAPIPVYVQALLEQTAENMEALQRSLARGEEGRIQANQAVLALTDRLSGLSDTLRGTHVALARLAEREDTGTTQLLRNIDATLQRLGLELASAQAQATTELRQDLRLLARTMAVRADEPPALRAVPDR
jgi:hypothetical protein